MKIKTHKVPGVFLLDSHLATKGEALYGEKVFGEYRLWNPQRSKLAALLKKGEDVPLRPDQIVLYLGAASGTTVSHLANIVSLVCRRVCATCRSGPRSLVRTREKRRAASSRCAPA